MEARFTTGGELVDAARGESLDRYPANPFAWAEEIGITPEAFSELNAELTDEYEGSPALVGIALAAGVAVGRGLEPLEV